MKRNRSFRILAAAVVLALLMLAVSVTPVLGLGAIALSTTSGPPGTVITVTGAGFTPAASGYVWFDSDDDTIKDATEPQKAVIIDVGSAIPSGTTLTVPSVARGTYDVWAEIGVEKIFASPGFTVTPVITIDPTSGKVGDTVTVDGVGFKASATVTIYYDTTSVGTKTADASGVFEDFTFTVPASAKGSHNVKGQDSVGASPTVSFTVSPDITINPTSGAVGDTVTVTGTGFAASSDVTISFDASAVGSASTNASGGFSATFTVPSTSRGSHTVKAQDESANFDTAILIVSASITLNPSSGSAGTEVTVTGTGFAASLPITIKYNNILVATTPSSVTTNSTGYFSAKFSVPAALAGSYVVQASDGANTATANFTSTTNASIAPTTSEATPGYVGMELTITGIGFTPSHTVTVKYSIPNAESILLASVTSDTNGNFTTGLFAIPPSAGGTHSITVDDGLTPKIFTFFMELAAPPTPGITAPLADAKLEDKTFEWGAVIDPVVANDEGSNPVTYDLQVSLDNTFSAESLLLDKTGLTTASYTLLDEEKLESTSDEVPFYYWRVRAVDAASNASLWSEASAFTTGFSFEFTGWVVYAAMALIAIAFFFIGLAVGRRGGGGGGYY